MHIRPVQLKLFYGKVPGRTFMSTGKKHLAPKNSHYENLVSGVFPKGAIKMHMSHSQMLGKFEYTLPAKF